MRAASRADDVQRPGYERTPQLRLMLLAGTVGIIFGILGLVVACDVNITPTLPTPGAPGPGGLPALPSLPPGLPALPTDFPSFPGLPSLPGLPGLPN